MPSFVYTFGTKTPLSANLQLTSKNFQEGQHCKAGQSRHTRSSFWDLVLVLTEASGLTSLYVGFFICKMGTIKMPISRGGCVD